jgi:hypothetical protein
MRLKWSERFLKASRHSYACRAVASTRDVRHWMRAVASGLPRGRIGIPFVGLIASRGGFPFNDWSDSLVRLTSIASGSSRSAELGADREFVLVCSEAEGIRKRRKRMPWNFAFY